MRASLVWTVLQRQKRWVWLTLAALVASTAAVLPATTIFVSMVDDGIAKQTVPLADFVGPILLSGTIAVVFLLGMRQCLSRLGYQVEFDLRCWLYRSLHSAELTRLDALASGQVITRALSDLRLFEQVMRIVPVLVGAVPILLALTLVLAFFSPPMAILGVAAVPVNIWLLGKFRHRFRGLTWAELNERAEVMSAIGEPVRGVRVVHAFGREDHERERVAAVALKAYRWAMTRWRLLARYDILLKIVPVLATAALLSVGASLVAADRLSLGTFLLSFQLMSACLRLAQQLDEFASRWQYLSNAQYRLGELLALADDSESDALVGRDLPPSTTGLELQGVTVGFDAPVLRNFDLSVAPGELVVVQGAPGSGKTTLARAAAGMLNPDAGTVRLDGMELRVLNRVAAARAVIVASEDPFLFSASLRDNVTFAATAGVGDETAERALWAAGADEVAASLSDGLATHVGDRGLTLSGGQRQRVALARALVCPPRVLVLDDALAAVNPSLEVDILQRIRLHAPQTAVVCMSRRAGPSLLADRVVELPSLGRPLTSSATPTGPALTTSDPADPALAAIVRALDLSAERPVVGEGEILGDDAPRVASMFRPFRAVIVVVLVALVLQSLGELAPQVLFGSVADIADDGDTAAVNLRASVLVLVGIAAAVGAYVFRIFSQKFAQGVVYILRRRTFHRLSRLGVDYFDRELPGQVAARVVNDLDVILSFAQDRLFRFLTGLAEMILGMAIILLIAPSASTVVVGFASVIVLVTVVQYRVSMRALNRARDNLGRVAAKFEEDFSGRREIRSFGATPQQSAKFLDAAWQLRQARRWATSVENLHGMFLTWVARVMPAIVLFRTGDLVLAGSISIGTALSVPLIAQIATQPLALIVAQAWADLLDVRVSWQRLKQPFDVPILPIERPDALPCPTLAGEVTFDHVGFTYPNTRAQVLEDISFAIAPGTIAALVGYTGAGKSSITKLLQRVYDPDTGAVRVDGNDLRDLDLASYRRRLGVVPQDAFVFRGTVASNIAYGRPDATAVEIATAAKAVGAHDVLSKLPGGYDHPVEEEGRNLTAAQRQLIALARAWIVQPDVLVLDEATSSLDGALEDRVLNAVSKLGCTTLMVTHRERVVEAAELIIVLDAGRVVEIGVPDQIVGSGGVYDRLWVADSIRKLDQDKEEVAVTAAALATRPRTRKPDPQ